MTGVAPVLVVLGGARETERVVPADRVADDLDERVLVDVVELPLQAGLRIGLAHERAGRRRVEAALDAPTRACARWNARKSEHCLPSTSITWMNSPARTSYASAVAAVDPDVEPRLGERGRELLLLVAPRRRAADLDEELGRRRRAVDDPPCRRRDDDRHGPLGAERLRRARG